MKSKGSSTDDIIFNIEDYVGGNIEGVEWIDRMGFTVFLRRQLNDLLFSKVLPLQHLNFIHIN